MHRLLLRIALGLLVTAPTMAWAGSPGGRWKGEWISASTGHRGPLRARIRPTSSGDYRALFAGRFAGIIPFVYTADLQPTGIPGQYVSQKQLPLIGTYRMSATITPGSFQARFTSGEDQGVFRMQRNQRGLLRRR